MRTDLTDQKSLREQIESWLRDHPTPSTGYAAGYNKAMSDVLALLPASEGVSDAYNTVLGMIEVARTEQPETALSRVLLQRARRVRDLLEPSLPLPPAPASTPEREKA